ncbi:PDZ domain-containing protein [Aliiglaciecola litoralis]|uniref:PDZ domain-containing protein n=2 Tax=Aliiglaciecola litoralis TaxID=582857 RepID=A0ABP3X044_9ALTE
MIRDFCKNIVKFDVFDANDESLPYEKLDKQSWRITPNSKIINITMLVYAYDLSVRSAYINDEYAFFNGTSLFLRCHGYSGRCSMTLALPDKKQDRWQIATSMPRDNSQSNKYVYLAQDYDELIDHPVLMGEFDIASFRAKGVDFKFVLTGKHKADVERICQDLVAVCEHHLALFDYNIPIDEYWFMTLLCEGGFGGLEHRASTVLQYARNELPTVRQRKTMPDGYRRFLSLCSHEFFHTWHVKRNKPDVFIQLDLSKEVYTEQLWIYEGFTSYVDDLSLVRSKLIEPESYLELLGQNLTRLSRNPGQFKQTVTESSFDAWTRFYQQDASAANNIVSYYAKGAEIALCLDLLIRQETHDEANLFKVMQLLWRQFGSINVGTQIDSINSTIKQHLNIDLGSFFQHALYSTKPLPTEELLRGAGIEVCFRSQCEPGDKGGKSAEKEARVGFGASYEDNSIGVKITQVLESSPAYEAELFVGDVLISVEQWQVSKSKLQSILDDHYDQQYLTMHVLRDGRLVQLNLPVHEAQKDIIYLQTRDPALRDNWLMRPNLS